MAAEPGRAGRRARAGHAAQRRRVGRLDRRAGRRAASRSRPTASTWCPVPARRGRRRGLLRGHVQRHAVAAVPRRDRRARSSTATGGRPTSASTAASPRPRCAQASDGALVWVQDYQLQLVPADAARAASGPADRLLQPHPVPAVRDLRPAPVAPADARGPARRRPARLPAAGGRQQLPAGLPPQRARDAARHGAAAARSRGSAAPTTTRGARCGPRAFPISIDAERIDAMAAPRGRPRARAREIRARARRPATCSCSASTGSTTPRASCTGSRRSRSCSRTAGCSLGDAVLVQVATPSRERVEQYRQMREDVEVTVGRINGDYGQLGRPAVHYLHQAYPRDELAALYLAADVLLVTSLRDGMNLVAKEYVAAALRRARRAGAQRVHRRGDRAAAGVPGEPARHRRPEGRDHERGRRSRRRRRSAGCARCAGGCSSTTSRAGPRRSCASRAGPVRRTRRRRAGRHARRRVRPGRSRAAGSDRRDRGCRCHLRERPGRGAAVRRALAGGRGGGRRDHGRRARGGGPGGRLARRRRLEASSAASSIDARARRGRPVAAVRAAGPDPGLDRGARRAASARRLDARPHGSRAAAPRRLS